MEKRTKFSGYGIINIIALVILLLIPMKAHAVVAYSLYGIDVTNKWLYHVTDSDNNEVEVRHAKLCEKIDGVNSGTVQIPDKITIKGNIFNYEYEMKVTAVAKGAYYHCGCRDCNNAKNYARAWAYVEASMVSDMEEEGNYSIIYENWEKAEIELADSLNKPSKVIIPKSVNEIREGAFLRTYTLTELEFEQGSNLKKIENNAFMYTDLERVTIPAACEVIGSLAFDNNILGGSLKEIKFEEGSELKEIGSYAFFGASLETIELPENCAKIGYGAFIQGSNIENNGYVKEITLLQKEPFITVGLNNEQRHREFFQYMGTGIEKINVQNYNVYSDITSGVYYLNDGIEFDCANTRFHITYDGKERDIDIPKGTDVKCSDIIDEQITGKVITGYSIAKLGKEVRSKLGISEDKEWNESGVVFTTDGTPYVEIALKTEPSKYQVKYDAAGGTDSLTEVKTYSYGEAFTLPITTRAGYTFEGWKIADDTSGTIYKGGSEVKNLTDKNGDVITLTAVWKAIEQQNVEEKKEVKKEETNKDNTVTVKNPNKVKNIKLKKNKKKKTYTLSCKAESDIAGLEIKLGKSKKIKKAKNYTKSKLKYSSKKKCFQTTIKKSKLKKIKYIWIRAYRTYSTGKKYYGAWVRKKITVK